MSTDVIGSRYQLGSAVTCTHDATTWDARDTWLEERVLLVTPEPGCGARFAALAGALMDRSSAHLIGLYDIGATVDDFVVFGVPAATLSEAHAPLEEEEVLAAGHALGDALEALHERGAVHGDLHPGAVVVGESGDAALSPWPLAPRPQNWGGPGGFGSHPEERRDVSAREDLRALGAVLLGALAGPPVLSSEQVGNIEHELAGRAPNAVTIADRALTPPARGGYGVASELRDDCAAALEGRPVAAELSHGPTPPVSATVATRDRRGSTETSEGRRAALAFAASGAAVLACFGIAGSFGSSPRSAAHPVATHASGCVARRVTPPCTAPDAAAPQDVVGTTAAPQSANGPARLADDTVSVASSGAGSSGASARQGPPATTSTSTPATSATGLRPPATTTTTSAPPSTTTSSPPSTSTTTTSSAPTTTTTTTSPPSTTTSTSPSAAPSGPSQGQSDSSSGLPSSGHASAAASGGQGS